MVGRGDGGVRRVSPAAPGGGSVHPRRRGPLIPPAVEADCSLPFQRPRSVTDDDRFRHLAAGLKDPQLLPGALGDASRALLAQSFRPLTRRSYMSRWRAFATYSRDRHLRALPADAATIFGKIALENGRGALPPKSLAKYLSTIRTVHAMACHSDPTSAKVVSLAVAGHKAAHAERMDGQNCKRLPIPAEFIKRVLLVGVYTTDVELSRRCCGLVWAYVLFNRPGAAADMRFKDFRVTAAGVEGQVPSFTGGVRQGAARIAVVVPFSVTNAVGGDDVINLLARLLNEHAVVGRRADERLFSPGHFPAAERARDLGAGATSIWLAELLARLDVSPPLGASYSGHSLRSGAASAAYSLGFPVEVVADLCAHRSVQTTLRYYIAVHFRTTRQAQELLGRWRPPDLHLRWHLLSSCPVLLGILRFSLGTARE